MIIDLVYVNLSTWNLIYKNKKFRGGVATPKLHLRLRQRRAVGLSWAAGQEQTRKRRWRFGSRTWVRGPTASNRASVDVGGLVWIACNRRGESTADYRPSPPLVPCRQARLLFDVGRDRNTANYWQDTGARVCTTPNTEFEIVNRECYYHIGFTHEQFEVFERLTPWRRQAVVLLTTARLKLLESMADPFRAKAIQQSINCMWILIYTRDESG